ncbi:MAG: DUF1624 domain-containing protein [Verrucomicrobia bacterium]|nr:DUF1624 domain-containing protein [Verrucomicrobiota bacterium]
MSASASAPDSAQASASAAPADAPARPRLERVDFLRGLVMLLMALDHTRDFFGAGDANPRDITQPALFLTRWITHFCAPTFVFLAGVSAFLYAQRGRTRGELTRFLLTRGLWLIVLEFTLVRIGWTLQVFSNFLVLQVIWAIGCALIFLALLVHLPRWAVAAVGLLLLAGHNLLDPLRAADFGRWDWLWMILHESRVFPLGGGFRALSMYPLLPWLGTAAVGYAFAPVLLRPAEERRRVALTLGAATLAVFLVLRLTGLYGDPAPRVPIAEAGWSAGLLSILNCEKYPPSLLFLCMTLGPLLLALGALPDLRSPLARAVTTFGRVPMLFYVVHLYVIHVLAIAWVVATTPDRTQGPAFPLPAIYAVTLLVLLLLYPLCHWFAALKARRKDAWLTYL